MSAMTGVMPCYSIIDITTIYLNTYNLKVTLDYEIEYCKNAMNTKYI